MGKKSKKQEEIIIKKDKEVEVVVAQLNHRNTIIIAVIGLIGTVLTAYFGYLSNLPVNQTSQEPAQAEVFLTPLKIPNLNAFDFPQNLTSSQRSLAIVYPSCDCYESVRVSFPFTIRLRWGGKTAALAESGADLVLYSLKINEMQIKELDQFRKPAIFAQDAVLEGDDPEMWWVYWDYLVQNRDASEKDFLIQVELITLGSIDTGREIIPESTFMSFESNIKIFLYSSPPSFYGPPPVYVFPPQPELEHDLPSFP